jgi:hypothetical protein
LYGLGPRGTSWENGVDLEKWAKVVDALHPTFYFIDAAVLERKLDEYRSLSAQFSAKPRIIPAIRAILPQTASESDLIRQVRTLAPIADGFSFYNYGFMATQTLTWIGGAIKGLKG